MQRSLVLLLTLASVSLCCSKDRSTQPKPPQTFDISGYYADIDTLYYKLWSDDFSEEWFGRKSIDGIEYLIVTNSSGYKYYYSASGYAGFQSPGSPLVLFDKPIPPLPQEVEFEAPITSTTTFSYGGNLFNMKISYTLIDTSSVSVVFGTFNPCPHFSQELVMSVSDQGETTYSEFWLAKGPGSIQARDSDKTVINMIRGFVNGQAWGEPQEACSATVASRNPSDRVASLLLGLTISPSTRFHGAIVPKCKLPKMRRGLRRRS
jgi:hypothetical protein